jgi:dihydrofolate reductase
MRAIIAVNNLGYIGKDNKLIWYSPDDLAHFKDLTLGSSILVGYNTYYSLPSLPNRDIMLDDRNHYRLEAEWCIGGKRTYEKYAPYFTELHISHIDDNTIGDIMLPDFKDLNPRCEIFNYKFKPIK